MVTRLALITLVITIVDTAWAGNTDDHKALMIAGQVMRNNGKLLRAREILSTCATDACDGAAADCEDIRAYCKNKLAELAPDIPSITVRVEDDRGLPIHDASVLVDTVPIDPSGPFDVDPGAHLVRASYAGRSGSVQLEAARGRKDIIASVVIDLRTDVVVRPVPWYTIAFGVLAGVATATTIGFGVAAQVQANALSPCSPTCNPSQQNLFTATTVTVDVALGVAIASAVVATFGYFLRPSYKRIQHVQQRIMGGS